MPIVTSTAGRMGYFRVNSSAGVAVTVYGKELPSTLAGSQDVYVTSYTTAGVANWAATISGSSIDQGLGTTSDLLGNLYVSGTYTSTLTAYNQNVTPFATTLTTSGGTEAFIGSYSPAGQVRWLAKITGVGADIPNNITTDTTNSVYVCGSYASTLTLYNGNGSAFATTLAATTGGINCFLAKYDSSGNVQWGARIASTGNDSANSIQCDSSNNAYVTGYYGSATCTFFNASGTAFFSTYTSAGASNCFLAKYNSSGNVQWATKIVGNTGVNGRALTIEYSGNFVYIGGECGVNSTGGVKCWGANNVVTAIGLSQLATTAPAAFIAKYNASGVPQWITYVSNTGLTHVLWGAALDPGGNLLITGTYSGAVNAVTNFYNVGGAASGATLASNFAATTHCFIAKYSSAGTLLWATYIRGSMSVTGMNCAGRAITTDASSNVYVSGFYSSGFNTSQISIPLTLNNATSTGVGAASGFTLPIGANFNGPTEFTVVYNSSGTVTTAMVLRPENPGESSQGLGMSLSGGISGAGTGAGYIYKTGYYISKNRFKIQDKNTNWTNLQTVYAPVTNRALISPTTNSGTDNWLSGAIVKFSQFGTPIWYTFIIGTTSRITSIVCDSSENVYVSGYYRWSSGVQFYNAVGGAVATVVGASLAGSGNSFTGWGQSGDAAPPSTKLGAIPLAGFITKYSTSGAALFTIKVTGGADNATIRTNATAGYSAGAGTNSVSAYVNNVAVDSSSNMNIIGTWGSVVNFYNSNGTLSTTINGENFPYASYNWNRYNTFLAQYSSTGNLNWAAKIISSSTNSGYRAYGNNIQTLYNIGGGVDFDMACQGNSCIVDSSSNIIITVECGQLTLFNATGGGSTSSAGTNFGYVLAKYNSTGTVEWLVKILGANGAYQKNGRDPDFVNNNFYDKPYDPGVGKTICVDSSNNIYSVGWTGAVGQTFLSADGSGGGSITITTALNNGFVLKYSPTGALQWVSSITCIQLVNVNQITCDSLGNSYVVGVYGPSQLTLTNATGGGTTVLVASTSSSNGFIAKYNSSGTVQWAARLGVNAAAQSTRTIVTGVSTDTDNNIYVTGIVGTNNTTGTYTFFSGNNIAYPTTLTRTTTNDSFLVKYHTNGRILWASINGTSGLNPQQSPFCGIATSPSKAQYVYANNVSTSSTNPGRVNYSQ